MLERQATPPVTDGELQQTGHTVQSEVGHPRATSIDGIALSDEKRSRRTRADPPLCAAVLLAAWLVAARRSECSERSHPGGGEADLTLGRAAERAD